MGWEMCVREVAWRLEFGLCSLGFRVGLAWRVLALLGLVCLSQGWFSLELGHWAVGFGLGLARFLMHILGLRRFTLFRFGL